MKNWIIALAIAAVMAGIGHYGVLYNAPSFIMGRAMTMLEERGSEKHNFMLADRTTPETQSVVRSSPDLAYSVCLYDLNDAPEGILVTLAATPGYSSLAFFDAETNNYLTLRGNGAAKEVRLLPPGANEEGATTSPTQSGVILIRRLTPTAEEYEAAAKLAVDDSCAPLGE